MSSDSDFYEFFNDVILADITEAAVKINIDLLSEKSRRQYVGTYNEF